MYYRRMWSTGINRNIVECKEIRYTDDSVEGFVLIETLWNVKSSYSLVTNVPCIVLIETLWNVKRFMLI